MMNKKNWFVIGLLTALPLCGQNLIVNSDFSGNQTNLVPECRSNGGAIALFTEDLTWNKCGQLKVDKIAKTPDGHEQVSSAVWIGGGKNNLNNDSPGGFECKPDTVYQFSLDIRGTAPAASVSAIEWKDGAGLWKFKLFKTSIGSIVVQPEWTNYKGTFKTGPDATHAALYLQLWWNTKHGPMKFKVGDYLLFDNIVITEQKANPLSAPAEPEAALKPTKTVSSANGIFGDFVVFKSNDKPSAETAVEVFPDKTGVRLKIDCREPLKVTPAANGLWSGDVIEIFFGAKSGDRRLSQFVVGPDGTKFSGRGGGADAGAVWEARTTVTEGGWHADVHVPFSSLGWANPENGESIAFNVARQRKAANELQTWSEVKSSFHDVEHFGRLLLGPYPGGMNRAQYEIAQAQKEAAALKEKFEKNAQRTVLVAPVRITEDFSVPFLPDAVFSPPEKMELKAAVNEFKPLALAIANTTGKPVEYRIRVEIKPAAGETKFDWHDGKPFPGVTLRQGVRMRDSGNAGGALLDPLPRLNEASTILVPSKEAGLLWLDFDTAEMKPGNYEGRIRIVPLNGKAIFSQAGHGYGNLNYSGEMTDVPFTLQVRDIELSKEPAIPGNFFSPPANQESIQLLTEAGMRVFLLNPWSLNFPLDNEGRFKPEAPGALQNLNMLSNLSERQIFIGYSCYRTFLQLYKNQAELWPEWLKTVAQFMKQNGADLKKCYLEVYDEPDPKNFDEILRVMAAARKAVPEMKLTLTLGAHIMSAEQMEKLHPYVDCWILWSHGYFGRAEHLAFIRKAQSEGREIGHYTCDTALRSSLDRNYRRNAWFGEYHQLDINALYQGITGQRECVWKRTPEGEILYHGLTSAIPSVRYMAFRQGMTDVKYLAKLREAGKDSPEAQAFLKNAAKRVAVDFAHDPETADKVREEAAALILRLQTTK